MKQLHVSDSVAFPLEAVTSTIAVLGKKGSGKTYTAKKLTELMLTAGFQVVILDIVGAWWGLKSSADGKAAGFSIPILGGKRADIPLVHTAGEVTARAIIEGGFSCIIDIGQFSKTQRHQFAAPFLETLYQFNEHAMHLMVDEADFYAPQKTFTPQSAQTLGAMDELVRRGRQRGVGVSLISQRPQVLNKDVLTQADLLMALRFNHPRDIDAIMEWVRVKADPREAKQMTESLPGLPTGDFWAWAPDSNLFVRGHADPAQTFDSSATPKPGQRHVAPKVLAEIDIAKLGEQIKATVEEQKANDPAALKARIRELERAVAQRANVTSDISIAQVERDSALRAVRQHQAEVHALRTREHNAWKIVGSLRHVVSVEVMQMLRNAEVACESTNLQFADALKELNPNEERPPLILDAPPPSVPSTRPARMPIPDRPGSSLGVAKSIANSKAVVDLNEPKRKILNAIATFEDAGVPPRLGAIAGYLGTTRRSRGFEENIRQLRSEGFVETRGDVLKMLGPFGTVEAMQGDGALRKVLSEPQYKMLQAVRETPGVSAESLATFMQTTVRARGFEENLRRLRADELLVGGKDRLQVAEWLR